MKTPCFDPAQTNRSLGSKGLSGILQILATSEGEKMDDKSCTFHLLEIGSISSGNLAST